MMEPEDLEVASCNGVAERIIYMAPASLGHGPLADSWIESLPDIFTPSHRAFLRTLIDSFYRLALPSCATSSANRSRRSTTSSFARCTDSWIVSSPVGCRRPTISRRERSQGAGCVH